VHVTIRDDDIIRMEISVPRLPAFAWMGCASCQRMAFTIAVGMPLSDEDGCCTLQAVKSMKKSGM